ncbi:MAG TPA: hypothetical protein VG326_00965 [Tepidisphaeraceae bacterium]|nr:hypothetical protein [Tepidisphaeraceae bacterium]
MTDSPVMMSVSVNSETVWSSRWTLTLLELGFTTQINFTPALRYSASF